MDVLEENFKNVRIYISDGFKSHVGINNQAGWLSLAFKLLFQPKSIVYIFGSWQYKPLFLLLISLVRKHPIYYSPKGQLCSIEFANRRLIKRLYLLFIESLVVLSASRIILNSKIEQANLVQPIAYLSRKKSEVVPEGLHYEPSVKEILRSESNKPQSIRLAILAKFSARKRLDNAIDLVNELQKKFNVLVDLHVVGEPTPAYQRQWDSIRHSVRQNDNIHFHGAKTGESKWSVLKDVDCFLIPSLFESFGLVVLESALLQRKMLVSKNVGALDHLDSELYYEFPSRLTDVELKNILGYLTSPTLPSRRFSIDEYNANVRKLIIDIHKRNG